MKSLRTPIVIGAGVSLLAVFACNRRDDRTGDTTTTNGTPTPVIRDTPPNPKPVPQHYSERTGVTTTTGAHFGAVAYETATARIVTARCDREVQCNNIGAKERFADRTVCTHELGVKLADDLKPSECPNGVDAKNLDDCLTAIQKEACGNIVDTISRVGACKTSGLCLKADEKPSQ